MPVMCSLTQPGHRRRRAVRPREAATSASSPRMNK